MLGCIVVAVVLVMTFLALTVVLPECNSGSSAGNNEGRLDSKPLVREQAERSTVGHANDLEVSSI